MAQITTLKDKEGKTLYPITSGKAVFDGEGVDLETKVNGKVEKVQGKGLSTNDFTNDDKEKLTNLPTPDELSTALNGKQERLRDSEDVTLKSTDQGTELTVTERAKRVTLLETLKLRGGSKLTYDQQSDTFTLNGISGLTWTDMEKILLWSDIHLQEVKTARFKSCPCKTLFNVWLYTSANLDGLFSYSGSIEVIPFRGWYTESGGRYSSKVTNMQDCFYCCSNLREVWDVLEDTASCSWLRTFHLTTKLELIRIKALRHSLDLSATPVLSLESLTYMVENAANTSAITITVHANVYAKLTGDESKSAFSSLSAEEKAQWTAVLDAALAKNIAFATA